MSTKIKVLRLLLSKKICSEEEMAKELKLERAEIFSSVKSLAAKGYEIEYAEGGIYNLKEDNILSEDGIRANFSSNFLNAPKIIVYDTTDSTNTRAKIFAEENGDKKNALFVANGQTSGRGRRGRSFMSKKNVGLYISFLTYPKSSAKDGVAITAYTAVAVCRAIRKLTGLEPQIKWVNDIYINGKKLAGILTEGSVDIESGGFNYAITGIGINVYEQNFENISHIATSLEYALGKKISRCALCAYITEEFINCYDSIGTAEIAQEYRARSFIIGKRVTVQKLSAEYTAEVLEITDKCELKLRLDDGSTELLSTGEVSLKI